MQFYYFLLYVCVITKKKNMKNMILIFYILFAFSCTKEKVEPSFPDPCAGISTYVGDSLTFSYSLSEASASVLSCHDTTISNQGNCYPASKMVCKVDGSDLFSFTITADSNFISTYSRDSLHVLTRDSYSYFTSENFPSCFFLYKNSVTITNANFKINCLKFVNKVTTNRYYYADITLKWQDGEKKYIAFVKTIIKIYN